MTGEGQNMELTANIHREDGSYWADVSELPGCFASGDNLDELFASLREGIQLYLESDGHSTDNGSLGSRLQIKVAVLSDAVPA
jgi:predicted RNase H-like HicB family nuclease